MGELEAALSLREPHDVDIDAPREFAQRKPPCLTGAAHTSPELSEINWEVISHAVEDRPLVEIAAGECGGSDRLIAGNPSGVLYWRFQTVVAAHLDAAAAKRPA